LAAGIRVLPGFGKGAGFVETLFAGDEQLEFGG
jgi:hypothetical protein